MPKKDPLDTAAIERAERFDATIFLGTGRYHTETFSTLQDARNAAPLIAEKVKNGRKAMIYAISHGRSVFVPDHYQPATTIEGDETLKTDFSSVQVAQLTATITGGGFKRANSKEAAVKRFLNVLTERVGKQIANECKRSILQAATLDAAKEQVIAAMQKADKPAASPKVAPAKAPAAKAPAAAEKPTAKAATGKRAAILEAAQRGELPPAPDFSAPTHKPHRKKLEQVIALVEAGDIAGLRAFHINPVSSSPKAIARYRDLAVIALEARKAAA